MVHARTEHNGLHRLLKDLVGLLDPLRNNVASDLHAPGGGFLLTPLARYLLGIGHVDLFGDEHLQWHKHILLNKLLSRDC